MRRTESTPKLKIHKNFKWWSFAKRFAQKESD